MRRGAGIWVVVSLLLTLVAGPPAASAGERTDARVEPPAATAAHHRVLVAYVTNRGAWSTTPEQIADAVDGALERWREVVPRAFLSLERVGDPVAYAASAMPSPESRCGLRYERPNELAASLAEARASMGVAPVPGVVDHLVVVVPLACTSGFAMGHTGFVASLDAGGGSIISEQRTGVSPTLQDHVFEEIGHSLSLGGADLGCPPGVESCMTWFHGDCWSPMARGQSGAQLSTAHLAAAGILQPGEIVAVNTDSGPADQLVTLRPRGEPDGLRGIEVTDPETGRTYYVDYRSGTGADAAVPPSNPPCPTGVAITELLPRRSTVLVPKVLKDMTNIGHDGITWAAGDSAALSSSLSVDVLAVDPVLGATVRVRAADPPRFGRVPKAELTGRVAGEHVGVSLGTFRPAPTRLVHRWYLNGVLVRGADGSLTETESLILGKRGDRLVGEVVAIRPGRRRAVVRTPSVSLVRGLRIRQVRLVGELSVGHRLTVRFERPRNPKHLKVRYVWRVGGVKLSVPGKRLVLTPAMAHKRVQVTVIARAPGYEKVTITVARPQTVRP
jgi:hypothetical protein